MTSAPFQLLPALPEATEAALRASILRFGVIAPVVIDQHGRVLDGHHRAAIADALHVPYRRDIVQVADDDEARAIAATLNCDRRQLDPDQRREIVAELRQEGHSLRAIAGAVGVSEAQVRKDVRAEQLRTGTQLTPEKITGLDGRQRRPTIVTAKSQREAERAAEALRSLGDDAPSRVLDLRRAERLVRENRRDAYLAERRGEPVEPSTRVGEIEIRAGDFREVLADLEPGSVDLIFTDPPYLREFMPVYSDLGEFAARVLKPGALLITYAGQYHLPEALDRLRESLTYVWTAAVPHAGQHAIVHEHKIWCSYKPLLVFSAGRYESRAYLSDHVANRGAEKDRHEWQQSIDTATYYVTHATDPGDLVCDPFLGSGTTAVACRDLGRRFVGSDIDPGAVSVARERLAEAVAS